jgi:sulfur-oxidizing protein SoxZ
MANKIKVKAKLSGDIADIQSLMLHPMETGARKNPDTNELVPPHHITQLTFVHNGEVAMVADLSTAVSENPYFRFKIRGAKAGDSLKVSWVDNLGETAEIETALK